MTTTTGLITFGLLLMLLCKGVNDLVFHAAYKYRSIKQLRWLLQHDNVRWSIGGVIGAIVAYVMVSSFITMNIPSTCIPTDVVPETHESVAICYTNGYVSTNTLDTQKIQEWVAYAIWYEARGESAKGRQAVASVLWNRAGGEPRNILGVLQNTNWLGRPELLDPSNADPTCPVYKESWLLAGKLVAGEFQSTGKWTHFYAPAKATPYWRTQLIARTTIGNHIFGVLP